VFIENGPYKMGTDKDLTLTLNPDSWHKKANMLYVDNPIGTGFSIAKNKSDYDKFESSVSADFHAFLIGFIKDNPVYKGRDFYITGESYAGHYIPSISNMIVNSPDIMKDIVFKGIAIGNGWVDPVRQYPEYLTFANTYGLIDQNTQEELTPEFIDCISEIKYGKANINSFGDCETLNGEIIGMQSSTFNVYNIHKKCDPPPLCSETDNIKTWANKADVKSQLGVAKATTWTQCDNTVNEHMQGDHVTSTAEDLLDVLAAKVNVLIYSGADDYICNWMGGRKWAQELDWPHKDEFNAATNTTWIVNGGQAGSFYNFDNFTFLKFDNAGHQVPQDSPLNALTMFGQFLAWDLGPTGEEIVLE